MADYRVTDTELTKVANAIRAKGGTEELLVWPDGYVSAIATMPSGSIVRPKPSATFDASTLWADYSWPSTAVNMTT